MSKILFLHSLKLLSGSTDSIELIDNKRFNFNFYPCLKGKPNIYEVKVPLTFLQATDMLKLLKNDIHRGNIATFLLLEETDDAAEIDEYNTVISGLENIYFLGDKNENGYHKLKYLLEGNLFKPSIEYRILNDQTL